MEFDLFKYLSDNGVEKLGYTGNSIKGCCPFHADNSPSWVIYTTPPYRYECFGCHATGYLKDLKDLGFEGDIPGGFSPADYTDRDLSIVDTLDNTIEIDRVKLPVGYIPLESFSHKHIIYEYLHTRGVLDEYTKYPSAYRFGISGFYPGYLIMPVIYKEEVVYWTGRAYVPVDKDRRFENPKMVGTAKGKTYYIYSPRLVDTTRKGVVVEGQFDTMKALSLGYNAVGTFNASPSKEQVRQIARKFDEVTIAYDNDMAGNEGAKLLSTFLMGLGVVTYRMVVTSFKDVGDYPRKEYMDTDFNNRKKMAGIEI